MIGWRQEISNSNSRRLFCPPLVLTAVGAFHTKIPLSSQTYHVQTQTVLFPLILNLFIKLCVLTSGTANQLVSAQSSSLSLFYIFHSCSATKSCHIFIKKKKKKSMLVGPALWSSFPFGITLVCTLLAKVLTGLVGLSDPSYESIPSITANSLSIKNFFLQCHS